jgi:hypothetical protein
LSIGNASILLANFAQRQKLEENKNVGWQHNMPYWNLGLSVPHHRCPFRAR